MGRQDWQWEVGSWLLRPAPPGTEPDTAPRPPGLFSTIMRDLANITHDGPKWIVLDGDIDPMWIESLNTVMDDNKVTGLPDPRAGPGPQSRGWGRCLEPCTNHYGRGTPPHEGRSCRTQAHMRPAQVPWAEGALVNDAAAGSVPVWLTGTTWQG